MAVPKENLLSLGHLISRGQDTLTKQRELGGKNSANSQKDLPSKILSPANHQHLRVMYLQQHLKELKERERIAQQHNRKLLQQFDEAQDALKEMLASNAAMKMIRIEYERYLQENGPYWQQQLKEKSRSAHEKRMKDHLKSISMNNEDTEFGDQPFSLQGPGTTFLNTVTPQEHFKLSQEGGPSHRYPQSAGAPIRSPYQSFSSSQVPPSFVPSSISPFFHTFPHHNLTSVPHPDKPWSMQDTDTWTSLQAEHPLSQITTSAGMASASECLLGQLKTEEPPPERRVSPIIREEDETSTSSSKRETDGGSGSNLLSQELDIKPVRLFSGQADSSESGRDSSPAHSKKKRVGKTRHSSDRHSSQGSSATSCSPAIAPVTTGQSSDSDAPSHTAHSSSNSTKMRSEGVAPAPGKPETVELQVTRPVRENSESPSEESQQDDVDKGSVRDKSANDRVENKYPDDKPKSCEEDLGPQVEEEEESDSLKIENGLADEIEKQENSSSEESGSEEEEENIEKNQTAGKGNEAEENSHEEKEDIKLEADDADDDDDDDVSIKISNTEKEEETGTEDEDTQGDDEDPENRKNGSASSQDDEEEHEGSEEEGQGSDEEDEDEEGEEEEEHRSDAGEPEEDRDSEDSIISPQEKRPKQMHVIPEDDEEEEEESQAGSSDGDSNGFSDDDIENLLAPQEQQKEEQDQKSEEKSTDICDKVQIFQVKQNTKSDHQSDSDEFDHFYD